MLSSMLSFVLWTRQLYYHSITVLYCITVSLKSPQCQDRPCPTMSRTSQVYIKAASTTVGKPSSLWSFRQGREAQTLVIFSILEASGGFGGKDWMVGLDLLKGEELLEPFLTRCSRNKTRQPVLGSFLGYQVSRHLQAEDSIVAAGAPQQKGTKMQIRCK